MDDLSGKNVWKTIFLVKTKVYYSKGSSGHVMLKVEYIILLKILAISNTQRPHWHIDLSLVLIPSVTSHRLVLEIVRFEESSPLTALKRVKRGKYPGSYKSLSFSSPADVNILFSLLNFLGTTLLLLPTMLSSKITVKIPKTIYFCSFSN